LHEPDFTRIGDFRYSRNRYEIIHRALVVLRDRVRYWNQVAISHQASQLPFEREELHLTNMVDWGDKQLQDAHAFSITVNGMSVESARLQCAALEYAASMAELEAKNNSKGMPPAVAESMLGVARAFAAEATRTSHPAHPILEELRHEFVSSGVAARSVLPEWDAFVSHASEDKDAIARPLAEALQARGLRIWFDEAELVLGDSLRQSIDQGLARSRFGIVVLSNAFFGKHWPQRELDGLDAREVNGAKVILPVWHGVDQVTVARYSPTLAGRLAVSTSQGIPSIVDQVLRALRR
jgi:hypothetical protein